MLRTLRKLHPLTAGWPFDDRPTSADTSRRPVVPVRPRQLDGCPVPAAGLSSTAVVMPRTVPLLPPDACPGCMVQDKGRSGVWRGCAYPVAAVVGRVSAAARGSVGGGQPGRLWQSTSGHVGRSFRTVAVAGHPTAPGRVPAARRRRLGRVPSRARLLLRVNGRTPGHLGPTRTMTIDCHFAPLGGIWHDRAP
jgi:hypothetical protein